MKSLVNIKFSGTFRDYQKAVLDRADRHIKDGRIHIVAAPGSGKTILGLELLCRLRQPTLILSPSVTIRQQWGERFESSFLPEGENINDYISFDLRNPQVLTSITYQALHAAYNKASIKEENDSDEFETETAQDYSDFNLMATVKAAGIKTICLDEAHHLRHEWQKALEGFIEELGTGIKIIALTATPPYDSTPGEWKSYTTLCGEIDEEIFVPQLVAQKTLCPHQDYIYFNYPTEEEIEILKAHKERALSASEEIICGGFLKQALDAAKILYGNYEKSSLFRENLKAFASLLTAARHGEINLPDRLIKSVSPTGKLPEYRLLHGQEAFAFIIDHPEVFTEEISEQLKSRLSQDGLIEKKKVCLVSSEKIDKMLVSSSGKLHSINSIAISEAQSMGSSLRMLILTDYIKKDMMKHIGSNEKIGTMGTVPIFESVRRVVGDSVKTALLSGSLVILPNEAVEAVQAMAANKEVRCSVKPIDNTQHSEVTFSGSNKNKVAIMTQAFQEGFINILIGTKSLLGEGWDAPCINSLILASFVGSFMLSNQMRGRAIRVDRSSPDKASNIWHLVTVEPPLVYDDKKQQGLAKKLIEDENKIISGDYNTLVRRFSCFLAPAYHSNTIESGMERIDILKPPFNSEGIAEIDSQMLALAVDRQTMAKRWEETLEGSEHYEILEVSEIPAAVQPKKTLTRRIIAEVIFAALFAACAVKRITLPEDGSKFISMLLLLMCVILFFLLLRGLSRILKCASPDKFVKSVASTVLKCLCSVGEIESGSAQASVKRTADKSRVYCTLDDATVHEKNVFSKAIGEILSAIDCPRYVLIGNTKLGKLSFKKYDMSFACPAALGSKKENVEELARRFKKCGGRVEIDYTRNTEGKDELVKCIMKSYLNQNGINVVSKKVLKTNINGL